MKSILKCALLTPVGSGHEETFENLCVPIIKYAIDYGSSLFRKIELMPTFDLEEKLRKSGYMSGY